MNAPIIYLAAVLLLADPASAASFDCSKASTKTEKLICKDAKLSRLDKAVAKAYKAAQACYTDPQLLKGQQKRWLKDVRDAASGTAAMKEAYTQRLKELQDNACPEQGTGALKWRYLDTSQGEGITLPFLTRGVKPEVLEQVNEHLRSLADSMGCLPLDPEDEEGAERAEGYNWETRAEVAYSQRGIFSVSIHSNFWCGTAYPTHDANQSMTFDLNRGERVAFEGLFKDYDADKETILTAIFGEAWEKTESKEDFNLETVSQHALDFVMRPQGLEVQPEFPHVIWAAAETVTVPYAGLLPYAAPGGLLQRAAR